MQKIIGTVISGINGPSTTEFDFVINNQSANPIRKNQFIQIKTEDGLLVARVDEILKTNRYFMRAESVMEYEKSGSPIVDTFPVDRWEYLVAKCVPLGIYANGRISRVTHPPSPGSNVEEVDEKMLSDFFGFDLKRGLHIGKLAFHNLDVRLNITRLFQKHMAILAMSGSGKCLSPETAITLSNGDIVPIGQLVDNIMTKNKIKNEDKIEYCKTNGLSVITLKGNKISHTKVKAVTRRKAPSKMLKITTSTGKELILTREHPLLSFQKEPIWKPVNSFKENDWIALPSIISTNAVMVEINLAKELKNYENFYAVGAEKLILELKNKCKLKWKEISKMLNICYSTLQHWKESGNIPLIKLFQFAAICHKNIDNEIDKIKFGLSEPISSKIKINEEMARFLGYLFGDGHNDLKTLRFINSKNELIDDFYSLSEKFIKKPYIKRRKTTIEFIIFNKTAAQVMDKIFGLHHRSRTKNIPDCILKSPNKIVAAYLKALFDCDGYCDDKKPEIELVVSNKDVVTKIENLLLRFGIYSVVRIKKMPIKNVGKKNYFFIYLWGVNNLKKFTKIGFSVPHKQFRLMKHLKLIPNPNIDVIPPTSILNDVLKDIRISQNQLSRISGVSQSHISRFVNSKRSFGKNTFNEIIDSMLQYQNEFFEINSKTKNTLMKLEKINNADIFWDRIKNIEEITPDFEYVYDLVLENSHNFIANNIIVHNSYLTSVLIEELLDRDETFGKPAIIVIDPHGEYKKFAEDSFYKKYVKVFGKDDIGIGMSTLSPHQIAELIPEMSSTQRRELQRIIENIDKKNYDFDDLIHAIESSEAKSVTKDTMIGWLTNLKATKMFTKFTRPSVDLLSKSGQLSVIDLSDFIRLNEKQILVTYFARKLFQARREGKIPPFILIVEEAHQFSPEGVKREGAISKSIIETIAREGRKFHASLVLISQRPIQLSTTALSQCNTHVILRVVNPYDLQHIGESSEGITNDVLKTLPGLRVGEALIVGEAVNFPVLVKVREKKSKKSSVEKTLEDALIEYGKKFKLDEKDIETFM
ncbi:MAG: helicase HerA domain-containing protein [Fervidobacterium sp.]